MCCLLLAANPDVVFSRKKILDTVWGGDLPEDTRTLDTHIKQIRRAITPHNDRIVTLRGVGYRLRKNNVAARAGRRKLYGVRLLAACLLQEGLCSGGRRPPRDIHCEAERGCGTMIPPRAVWTVRRIAMSETILNMLPSWRRKKRL